MAAEPEKKIEELLHAYSRKRREDAGAPLEMHPATRRMLQGEVARQNKLGGANSASPRPWWKTLLLFGPKYAGALGMFAILAVGVWVITQNDRASRNVRQETSERTAGTETPLGRTLGELAQREGEKLREADELADLRAPAKETENKKAELSKSLGAVAEQSKLQTRDADNKPSAVPAPAVPELKMTEDLAREKQVSLQKEQVGQRIANVIAGGAAVSADKNEAVLADSVGTPDNRFYKRNEGKADTLASAPPATQPLAAGLDLAAAKPTNGTYFAYTVVAPATNVSLGAEVATTALSAGVKLMIATNAPTEGYLNFADRFGAAVTEWAAAPADAAKDQLGRAREFRQEAESRAGASPAFLRRFSVEQNDGVIRIRDAEDGSVYLGEVVTPSESNVDGKAKAEVRQLGRNLDGVDSAPVTFRASGINQRSRQMVIINGQLTEEQERLSAIAGKVIEPVAQAAPTDPATGIPALAPTDGPSAARRDQAGATDRAAQGQARSSVRFAPPRAVAPTSAVSRATSVPVFQATTLRARVQIGATNELNFRAVRTR